VNARILALCTNPHEAAATQFLPSDYVTCVDINSVDAFKFLLEAKAVIFCRNLYLVPELLEVARNLRIPSYYLINENVITMREEPHHHTHTFHQHSAHALQSTLRDFEGVLVSSTRLAEYLRSAEIHSRVIELPPFASMLRSRPPAIALEALPFPTERVVRIAYFSAAVRQGLFAQVVLPALRSLAHFHNIELIAFGCAPGSLDDPTSPLRVRTPAWQDNYLGAMTELASWNPEIIVQPDLETLSTSFKLPHILLTAAQVGAAVVASRLTTYIDLTCENSRCVVLAANNIESWEQSIGLLLRSAALRFRVATEALSVVTKLWPREKNECVFARLESCHPAPGLMEQANRADIIGPVLRGRIDALMGRMSGLRAQLDTQAIAIEQYKQDMAEIALSLDDSKRILAESDIAGARESICA
jgi:hypothetical protein